MKKITGKDLRNLGFKKEIEKSGGDNYHYYTYEINNHCLLISCGNDEKVKGGYIVEIYEIEEIKFRDLKQVKKLFKLLKRATNE
jgi:hypothetical protein